MQNTHYCEGNYPTDVKPKDVDVWFHDSGMVMTHNYACPVCRAKSAVLDGGSGIMQPCWECQEQGYKVVKAEKRVSWLTKWRSR